LRMIFSENRSDRLLGAPSRRFRGAGVAGPTFDRHDDGVSVDR
jgi:hypothetical protein